MIRTKPCAVCGESMPAFKWNSEGAIRPTRACCSPACQGKAQWQREKDSGAATRYRTVTRQRIRAKGGRVNTWTDAARASYHRRRAIVRGAAAEKFKISEIYERDGWICQLCGEQVDPNLAYPDAMSASLDHVVPLSRGGAHVRTNVQLAHLICNIRKSDQVA